MSHKIYVVYRSGREETLTAKNDKVLAEFKKDLDASKETGAVISYKTKNEKVKDVTKAN